MVSKTQIDKLGERLKSGAYSDDDLRELDAYRQTFVDVYTLVVGRIRGELGLEPTGRPAKSTLAVVEKLQRETIRLSQIQDIAGCRIVVPTVLEQNSTVARLLQLFPSAAFIDRRAVPSHGYRAVHLVVSDDGRSVEIQIRSRLQHLWAELSEKATDALGEALKYGIGDPRALEFLDRASFLIHEHEQTRLLFTRESNRSDRIDVLTVLELKAQEIEALLSRTVELFPPATN